jgi:hypothetical protein
MLSCRFWIDALLSRLKESKLANPFPWIRYRERHYMAPEPTRGIVTTTDIYAGGVAAQMLVGELPYDDPGDEVVKMHLQRADPVSV